MITALFLIFAAVLTLGFLAWGALQRRASQRDVQELSRAIRPVDLEAFRNLMSADDEGYLRQQLPARVYRAVQRRRLWAAVEYVSCAAFNASVLTKLGDAARHSPDPELARAGQELVDAAVRLRLYCVVTRMRFYTGVVWPGISVSPASIADRYQRATGLVGQIRRLQHVRPAPLRVAS
ncbi:MAG TPA: hypothetical protein VFA89_04490 [Terriglobales bacterium]|nr:hypothetical protein [Terriglobales bacterium]